MNLPCFEAAPGMSAHLVRRASDVALPAIDATGARAYLQPRDPHVFSLRCDSETKVAIGESRFSVVQVRRGTAMRIFTTAVVDYVDRARAFDEAARVIDRLQAVGFVAKERIDRALGERLAARDEDVRLCEHTAPFGSGAWRAEVWLRTVMRAQGNMAEAYGLTGDQCLVNVVIQDDAQLQSSVL